MDRLAPMPAAPDADGGERLYLMLLSASRRSSAAVLRRLADAPAAASAADLEVRRVVARGD